MYQWNKEQLHALQEHGITPDTTADLFGYVWRAVHEDGLGVVIKMLRKDSPEVSILRKMLSLPSPRNKVIPGYFIECSDCFIYVMPQLEIVYGLQWCKNVTFEAMMRHFQMVIDHIEFMHENNMAFVDIWWDNLVWSQNGYSSAGFNLPADVIYFIDFGSARMLPAGPDSGIVVADWKKRPSGKSPPPEGTDAVDPYAYDVYMLNYTIMTWSPQSRDNRRGNPAHIKSCLKHFTTSIKSLDAKERPSASQYRRQFSALRTWMSCVSWTYSIFRPSIANAISIYGWRAISVFVR